MLAPSVQQALPFLMHGALVTVALAAAVLVLSSFTALAYALARLAKAPLVGKTATAYGWLLRGVPELIVLFFAYFGLAQIGVSLQPFPAAVFGMLLYSTAYVGEIVRAGIQSVAVGQVEAARALGLGHLHILRRIILPQALRVIIPPYASQATEILKGTTLTSVIAVPELLSNATSVIRNTYQPYEVLLLVALVFFALDSVLIWFQYCAERRVAVP